MKYSARNVIKAGEVMTWLQVRVSNDGAVSCHIQEIRLFETLCCIISIFALNSALSSHAIRFYASLSQTYTLT